MDWAGDGAELECDGVTAMRQGLEVTLLVLEWLYLMLEVKRQSIAIEHMPKYGTGSAFACACLDFSGLVDTPLKTLRASGGG